MRWLDGPDGRQRVYASWSNSGQLQIQVAEPVTHRKDISHRFAYKLAALRWRWWRWPRWPSGGACSACSAACSKAPAK
jgi:hypothetical protein